MVGTISTTVRGARRIGTGSVFMFSNLAASSLVGALLALAGSAFATVPLLITISVLSASYATLFLLTGRILFLPWPGQVPRRWADPQRPYWTALRYGTILGLSFSTPIRAGSLVVLGAVVALMGSPAAGALTFAIVGLLRALPAATFPLMPFFDDRGPETLQRVGGGRALVTLLDVLALSAAFAASLQGLIIG